MQAVGHACGHAASRISHRTSGRIRISGRTNPDKSNFDERERWITLRRVRGAGDHARGTLPAQAGFGRGELTAALSAIPWVACGAEGLLLDRSIGCGELARTAVPSEVTVAVRANGRGAVQGHYEPLRRAFANLLRNAAEAMGGRVELESEPGRGSTFTLVLPASAGPPNTVQP